MREGNQKIGLKPEMRHRRTTTKMKDKVCSVFMMIELKVYVCVSV